ncbi:MAG: class II aldolase/adducin family protein, partial [Gammaproteobacteria bacterium]|nr:class II aldolase/adducin family protein [Gammaproteobacteria bacterium]
TMLPEHIVAIDMDGRTRSDVRPSSEWRLHHAIYHHCTHANAVIHTHSVFCTALACLRRSIPAFHYMVAVAGGTDIRCSDYATFGTQALADNIIAALTDRRACLIANHGMVCYGDDLDRTLSLASEVETLAKQYWHACQLGEPNILSTEEMREVLEAFIDYRN